MKSCKASTDNPLPVAGQMSEDQVKTEYQKPSKEKCNGRMERINGNQRTS